jgi:hypothetical protein
MQHTTGVCMCVACWQGTLDCILCGADGLAAAARAVDTVYSNLKGGGVFMAFSHAPPSMRNDIFSTCAWGHTEVSWRRELCCGLGSFQRSSWPLLTIKHASCAFACIGRYAVR